MALPPLQMPNIAGNFAQGYQFGQGIAKERTKTQAGRLLAKGDTAGATTLALSNGELEMAHQIGQMSVQQREATNVTMQEIAKGAYAVKNAPPQEKKTLYTDLIAQLHHNSEIPQDKIEAAIQGINADDPNSIDSGMDRAITKGQTIAELSAAAEKAQDRQLQRDQFANTERHQGITEGLTRDANAETKRYHDIQSAAINPTMDQDTQDFNSALYLRTGQMPSIGNRSGQAKAAITAGAQRLQAIIDAGGELPAGATRGFEAARQRIGYGLEKKTEEAFGPGQLGSNVKSANVAIQHLDQLRELGIALQNKDNQTVNEVANRVRAWNGGADPTNFDFVKGLALDEVAKFVVGGNFTQGDREEIKEGIKNASSPQQIAGIIEHAQGLMAGQMNGLRQQYVSGGGQDFEGKLLPETLRVMKAHGYGAVDATGGAQGSPAAGASKFVEGQVYKDANGNTAMYKNGTWVPQ